MPRLASVATMMVRLAGADLGAVIECFVQWIRWIADSGVIIGKDMTTMSPKGLILLDCAGTLSFVRPLMAVQYGPCTPRPRSVLISLSRNAFLARAAPLGKHFVIYLLNRSLYRTTGLGYRVFQSAPWPDTGAKVIKTAIQTEFYASKWK